MADGRTHIPLTAPTPIRRAILGGSTIAAAAGIDPYCSPVRLWLEMTGRVERQETEAMAWGKRLQPVIFEALRDDGYDAFEDGGTDYADRNGWLVGHPDGFGSVTDGASDAASAPGRRPRSTDRDERLVRDSRLYIIEAKASAYGYTDLPATWDAQVQTYMHLTGAREAIVAQLAGLHLTVWEVERKPAAMEALRELGERFVGYVESGEQPPVEGHPDDRAALALAYPDATPRTVRETREVREARRELAALLEREKAWKARVEGLRAVITAHMGDADTLIDAHDETVATWRNVTSRRLDTARLKKERAGLYDLFSVETMTRRFVLS